MAVAGANTSTSLTTTLLQRHPPNYLMYTREITKLGKTICQPLPTHGASVKNPCRSPKIVTFKFLTATSEIDKTDGL